MDILLEQYRLPERGEVALDLHRVFQINITAEEARRKVNFWLLTELSYMLVAASPKLVIGEQVVWRVPALLTASHVGSVGIVGEVDVNVQTGSIDISPECKTAIEETALALAEKLPPYRPHSETPIQYLAKDKLPTQMAQQPAPHLT
jgi:hypothetical protein